MQGEKTDDRGGEPAARKRGGRPPAEMAGDVDRRILDSATALFLQHGFDGTSCDQVAVKAGAGKASIYARYANKEELFIAVVRRAIERTTIPLDDMPAGLESGARVQLAAENLLRHALQPDVVALMRLVITTAYRLPELAALLDSIGRDRGVRVIAEAITGVRAGEAAPDEPAMHAARKFIDMVFVPHQMRALIGDDLNTLQRSAPRQIEEAIRLLAASHCLQL